MNVNPILPLALASFVVAWILAYHRANGLAWSIGLAAMAAGLTWFTGVPLGMVIASWVAVGVFAAEGPRHQPPACGNRVAVDAVAGKELRYGTGRRGEIDDDVVG